MKAHRKTLLAAAITLASIQPVTAEQYLPIITPAPNAAAALTEQSDDPVVNAVVEKISGSVDKIAITRAEQFDPEGYLTHSAPQLLRPETRRGPDLADVPVEALPSVKVVAPKALPLADSPTPDAQTLIIESKASSPAESFSLTQNENNEEEVLVTNLLPKTQNEATATTVETVAQIANPEIEEATIISDAKSSEPSSEYEQIAIAELSDKEPKQRTPFIQRVSAFFGFTKSASTDQAYDLPEMTQASFNVASTEQPTLEAQPLSVTEKLSDDPLAALSTELELIQTSQLEIAKRISELNARRAEAETRSAAAQASLLRELEDTRMAKAKALQDLESARLERERIAQQNLEAETARQQAVDALNAKPIDPSAVLIDVNTKLQNILTEFSAAQRSSEEKSSSLATQSELLAKQAAAAELAAESAKASSEAAQRLAQQQEQAQQAQIDLLKAELVQIRQELKQARAIPPAPLAIVAKPIIDDVVDLDAPSAPLALESSPIVDVSAVSNAQEASQPEVVTNASDSTHYIPSLAGMQCHQVIYEGLNTSAIPDTAPKAFCTDGSVANAFMKTPQGNYMYSVVHRFADDQYRRNAPLANGRLDRHFLTVNKDETLTYRLCSNGGCTTVNGKLTSIQ